MVGDSITCGYGDLGMLPCTFSADTEDENAAWGALAARQVDAGHVAVAYSGKGMYRNYGGDMSATMPQIWNRVFADDGTSSYGFSQYQPDVVVVNLGTNDYSTGDPGMPFETAYTGFLGQVRLQYPNAFIVCATGPMTDDSSYQSHVQAAIAAAADPKVSYLDLGVQDCNVDGCGCDYHPSQVTQQKMADKLVAHLKTLLPW
ncbi:MAG: SGNH/GDSL hydrolase family protein [Myxococcaceae bacterium]